LSSTASPRPAWNRKIQPKKASVGAQPDHVCLTAASAFVDSTVTGCSPGTENLRCVKVFVGAQAIMFAWNRKASSRVKFVDSFIMFLA
jgi:hypothetical protein